MTNKDLLAKANGLVIYEGPSKIDGAPIVVIATGIRKASTNAKTGAMVQTYILRSDIGPVDAVKTGADVSICGDCKHRGDRTGKDRSCYVTLIHGPRAVYASYKRGTVYPKASAHEAAELLAGKMVRLGTYGDPAAAPFPLWDIITSKAKGWTGYTHQWKSIPKRWSRLVMASADSVEEMKAAHAKDYRTFRVTSEPFVNIKGLEVVCPASEERGKRADCFTCKACMGRSGKAKASIQIAAHGGGKKHIKEGV